MDDIIQLRIRIDGPIGRKAEAMAKALNRELADVIRMMLAEAVRVGYFSFEGGELQPAHQSARPYQDYDERQWGAMKTVLDAELALALINQYIASHTLQIDFARQEGEPDALVERLTRERDEARGILATLDPSDVQAMKAILQKYGPSTQQQDTGERDEGRAP